MIIDWQQNLPENMLTLPNELKNLMQMPSLTAALSQYDASFDVDLRYLGFLTPKLPQLSIHLTTNHPLFVREVFLRLNRIPVVWAISSCHQEASFWQSVLNRGNQPLGTFLFEKNSAEIKRSALEFSYNIHELCPNNQRLWSRRSVFECHNELLNLHEVFLPALFDFI